MRWLIAFALSIFFGSAALAADCAALPSTITAPCRISYDGSYKLGGTINGAGQPVAAIVIASGVTSLTLDCDGNRIVNHSGYLGRGVGIYGTSVAGTTIKNCDIFGSGMLFGIQIDNSAVPAYATITVKDSSISGTLRGLQIRSNYVTIQNNVFHDIGGQQIYSNGFPEGAEVFGANAVFTGNRVFRVWSYFYGETVGLACSYQCDNAVITDNVVENDKKLSSSWAIWMGGGTGGPNHDQGSFTVSGNTIKNWDNGYTGTSVSSGTMNGNAAVNVTTPYVGIAPPNWTGP